MEKKAVCFFFSPFYFPPLEIISFYDLSDKLVKWELQYLLSLRTQYQVIFTSRPVLSSLELVGKWRKQLNEIKRCEWCEWEERTTDLRIMKIRGNLYLERFHFSQHNHLEADTWLKLNVLVLLVVSGHKIPTFKCHCVNLEPFHEKVEQLKWLVRKTIFMFYIGYFV